MQHANFIAKEAANCFGKIARVFASTWGIKFPAFRILFSGSRWRFFATLLPYVPIAHPYFPSRKRCSEHRDLPVPVLAGVLPADLEVSSAELTGPKGADLMVHICPILFGTDGTIRPIIVGSGLKVDFTL